MQLKIEPIGGIVAKYEACATSMLKWSLSFTIFTMKGELQAASSPSDITERHPEKEMYMYKILKY